jgi:hypothetical protein
MAAAQKPIGLFNSKIITGLHNFAAGSTRFRTRIMQIVKRRKSVELKCYNLEQLLGFKSVIKQKIISFSFLSLRFNT